MITETKSFGRSRPLILGVMAIFVLVAIATLYWFVNPFRIPDKLEVLDQISLQDGKRLLLAQRFNGSLGEPSTITVYQELDSNVWISYYVDHESSFWRSGSLAAMDGLRSQFIVYRGSVAVSEIDCNAYTSTSAKNTQLVSKASIMDLNPLENPDRRPQSLGQLQR